MTKKMVNEPQYLVTPEGKLLRLTHEERIEAVPTSEYGRGDIVAPYERLVQGSQASGLGDSASPLLQQQQYVTTEKERVEGEEREVYGKGEIITSQETVLPDTLGTPVGGDSESPLMGEKPYVGESRETPPDLEKREMPEYRKDGLRVYSVNGQYVRDNLFVDFTMGGHDLVHPEFVPEGEIWIDQDMNDFDKKTTIIHEYVEREKMAQGMDYEDAHSLYANVAELKARQNPEMADRMLDEVVKGGVSAMSLGQPGEINDVLDETGFVPSDAELLGDYNKLPTLASARMEEEEKEEREKRGGKKVKRGKKGRPIDVGAFPDRFYLNRKLRPAETNVEF